MESARGSTTAWAVAMARVAHAHFDEAPPVFDDSLALQLIDPEYQALLEFFGPSERVPATVYRNRPYLAYRQRYQEERLMAAYAAGIRQYVILGAGLDSYAFRQQTAMADLQIYEVDFPATQSAKRQRIASLGWPWPGNLVFAPCDFARDSLPAALQEAGFDPKQPAYFAWMGVTIYLVPETVADTLHAIRQSSAPGSRLALEYAPPTETLSGADLACREFSLAQATRRDEPFLAFFTTEVISRLLAECGFARFTPLDLAAVEAGLLAEREHPIGIHHGFRLGEAQI